MRHPLGWSPTGAWRSVKRDPVTWALAAIVLLGALMRLYFLIRWHPALIGYSDSANYMLAAQGSLFGDPVRVAGYVLLLRLLHLIWPHLILVTITQHLLGIASGLLLFDAVRRAKAPRGLGLVPAAVVILGGSELLLEHTILTDTLFIFLTDLGLWCVVRTWRGSRWWALAAGLSFGASTVERTVGLELLPFALACLCIAPAGEIGGRVELAPRWGRRVAKAAKVDRLLTEHAVACWRAGALSAGVAGALLVIVPFLAAHEASTGVFNFTSEGNLDLYGRVAPWADCTKFTPPPGTANLCIEQPVSQRPGSQVWEFSASSPVTRVYDQALQPGENAKLGAFAEAAIEGQPLTYLKYVARDLVRVVDPSSSESPNPAVGNQGAGYSPAGNVSFYFNPVTSAGAENIVKSYYRSSALRAGNVNVLRSWERDTRLEGPAMALVLLLALLAPLLATGLPRRLAILLAVTSFVLIVGPILVLEYDYRFMIPAFGPLTACAAIGAYELSRRAGALARRREQAQR
jgi:hypothetical protein